MTSIAVETAGQVATVWIGTGERSNALGTAAWEQLAASVAALDDDSSVRVVVFKGRGGTAFCAGSDMREWVAARPAQIDRSFTVMEAALRAIEDLTVPTVAAVRGFATGAGCQLACACDLRFTSHDARLGMPIARWGIYVPPSFVDRLARWTGPSVAHELLLTGRLLDGRAAKEACLVNDSVDFVDLDRRTDEAVKSIMDIPAQVVAATKSVLDSLQRPDDTPPPSAPSADYDILRSRVGNFLARSAHR